MSTTLLNGTYRTQAGSTVIVSGEYSGIFDVNFDWPEEDACDACEVETRPEFMDGAWYLTWRCEVCGGGEAKLEVTA